MTPAIDIKTEERAVLLAHLRRHLPGVEVWAYGSRVKWTARPTSDLDIVVFSSPDERAAISALKEVLAESNLPFAVDLHVWDDVPERFHDIIRSEHVIIQEARKQQETSSRGRQWQEHKVSDLIDQGVLVVGDGYRAKNDELSTVGLPFARAGNINNGFVFRDADHFPEDQLQRVGNKVSRPGDVVFTSKGTVGRFAFVRSRTPRFIYSPQLCFWRSSDPDVLDPRFLYYWMLGREFYIQFKGVSGQTDMAEYVSLTDQRRMFITLPPEISEQRAIAGVLGVLDDKIESNRRTSRALERVARAIFRAWFVDFEPVKAKAAGARSFPGMSQEAFDALPTRFVESELGPVPEGWSLSPLDKTGDFLNGLALQKHPPRGDGTDLPVIKIAELRKGSTVGSALANNDIPEAYVISDGDLLFSWSGTLEALFWFGGRGALNQHLFKVSSAAFPKWFLYLWIRQHLPWFRQIASSKATTMGHIKRGHLAEAQVVVPDKETLLAADQTIGPLYELISRNEIESRTLATLRDYLLPKLLSGEVRVAEPGEMAISRRAVS